MGSCSHGYHQGKNMAINKNEFYEKYAPIAIEQQIKYGIPASVTLAQMGFESSFGTSRLARESSNFFGVKQGSSWKGPVSYHIDDHNHPEAFRVYQDVRASVEDHSKVLLLPRYQKHCGSKSSQDYQGWADGIMAGGYASKEDYKSDLIGEIKRYHLDKYDEMAVIQARKMGVEMGYAKHQKNPHIPMSKDYALPIQFENLKITGLFHEKRSGHLHGGVDISTSGKYLPVYATENNGKVISACYGKDTGNMIKVEYAQDDGTTLQCTYMHLSQIHVKVGDTVQAGQQIGISGNTGRSSGAHLHFETKIKDLSGKIEAFNPISYLAAIEGKTGKQTPLWRNGEDLLAVERSKYSPSVQPQVKESNWKELLANVTHSNDPTKWLAYLMSQNKEYGRDNEKDAFSELISTLFSAALTMAAKIKASEMLAVVNKDAKLSESEEVKDDSSLIKRNREKVDASRLQMLASTIFETEIPENKQAVGLKTSLT